MVVFLCLLDNIQFYLTGHQTTLARIPWDAAYAAYYGDHTTYWIPCLMVLSHLYAGPVLVVLLLPLVAIWLMKVCLNSNRCWIESMQIDWSRKSYLKSPDLQKLFIRILDELIWRFLISKAVLVCLDNFIYFYFEF